VRTRLYFTSESHVHSLLSILHYGPLCDVSLAAAAAPSGTLLLHSQHNVNRSIHLCNVTFTFRAFVRRFYPKRLTKSTFVEGDSNISLWYIKIRIEQV